MVVATSSCFTLISSGIQAKIPPGAETVGRPLAGDERVLLGWDGSFSQDGGLLVLVTDKRLIKHDDSGDHSVALAEISGIVVDEDEGRVVVQTALGLLAVPMRSSSERLELARVLQRAVQQAKIERADADAAPQTPQAPQATQATQE
jgi:hypothetical protein